MFKLLDYPLYQKPVREIKFENDSNEEIDVEISEDNSTVSQHLFPRQTVSFMTEHPLYYLFKVVQFGKSVSKPYPIRSNSNFITLKKNSDGEYQPAYFIQTAPPSY
jgi:hypothetical protein